MKYEVNKGDSCSESLILTMLKGILMSLLQFVRDSLQNHCIGIQQLYKYES